MKFGYIRALNREKNYGFITRQDGEDDIWFQVSQVKQAPVSLIARDTVVAFDPVLHEKSGKLEAQEVYLLPESLVNALDIGMTVLGEVTRYDYERNFGCVRAEDGGSGIFFHRRSVDPGYVPQVGDQVYFSLLHYETYLEAHKIRKKL
jgi:cold shock CspA family protein